MIDKTIWVCSQCGSKEVQERVWRNCNSGECDGIGEADEDDQWCIECQHTCEIVTEEEFKQKQDG